MPEPDISVVIPAWNPGAFLREAVQSVWAQSLKPLEVIVVDDGSDKPLESLVEGLNVRLFRNEHAGDAAARNRGVKEARGEWIAFLDADDKWEPETLKTLAKFLEKNPDTGVLTMDSQEIDESGVPLPRQSKKRSAGEYFSTATLLGEDYGHLHTPMVLKKALLEAGLFDTSLTSSSDMAMWLRLSLRVKVASVRQALLLRRRHGASKSATVTKINRFSARVEVLEKFCREHPEAAAIHKAAIDKKLYRFYRNLAKAHCEAPESKAAEVRRAALRSMGCRRFQIRAYKYWLKSFFV